MANDICKAGIELQLTDERHMLDIEFRRVVERRNCRRRISQNCSIQKVTDRNCQNKQKLKLDVRFPKNKKNT